ncbi:hypothetical protein M413DRAFT_438439 [Hebeloma cylindrosporum]|uniref:Peptidase M24 domain-containing protein n=1 Tax=Hebeloma cylindrosporum TaxID=76867 RepID=A0A0C3CYM6_HEBCY|nr:hypothetical protein M413DRAFT_438439 [Hebeloma cylindrosporum h7]
MEYLAERKAGKLMGIMSGLLVLLGIFWLSVEFPEAFQHQMDSQGSHSSWPDPHLASHCASTSPIRHSEYLARQTSLARTLHSLGAKAYIAEPGANTQFFANFSKAQWTLSERPLLLVISPITKDGQTQVLPEVTILTPKFEATRARTLPIPSPGRPIKYIEWSEEADPYVALLSALTLLDRPSPGEHVKVFVDNSIRKFIVDGLQRASGTDHTLSTNSPSCCINATYFEHLTLQVLSAPFEITQLRERKSEDELRILKCANEATLLAIRDVHKKLYPGIRESQARTMMALALGAAGLKDGGCLTLFGENAALPHGSGTDRTLAPTDFALFDCTASLHEYYSDVTRTVSLTSKLSPEQRTVWSLVQAAQAAALQMARNGTRTRDVDSVARAVIGAGGYEKYFTHRLGHGIGLEVHEQPYLRGGSDDIINIGHTFSDEPGIYIEGKVGVRLEDCFFINEDGVGIYLTEGVGGASVLPWLP